MRKSGKKAIAVVTAAALSASMCMTAAAADKEEIVYVKTDAYGTVTELTVSDHLVNAGKLDTLTDISDLDGIENVKGEETYEVSEDGSMIWNAAGSDIYYQGTSEKELPVDLHVTYYLDEQEVSPEELAGKSGHVKIRMDYTNQCETEDVKVPFVVIGGMLLPDDKFENVEVVNGKIINDGKNTIAVGMAFPGLEESLFPEGREDDLDFEIPQYIEVSMDTESFELTGTMHAVSASLSDILELDEIESTDDLEDKIKQISDASDELTQGSADLLEGMNELKEKSGEFADGVTALGDGIAALEEGAVALQNGASALKDGSAQLQSGTVSLGSGLNQLQSGAAQLQQGVNTLYANSSKLDDGSGQILSALDQINTALQTISFNTDQMTALVNGSESARQGIAQLAAGLQTMQGQFGEEGQIALLKSKNAAAAASLAGLKTQIGEAAGQAAALMTAANALYNSYIADNESVNPAVTAIMTSASALMSEASSSAEMLGSTCDDLTALLNANNAAFDSLSGGISQLSGGASTLLSQYETLNAAIAQLPSLVNGILQQMTVLQKNIALLDSKYAEFDQGLDEYLNGYKQIVGGYQVLYNGINAAASGAGALIAGSSQLYSGAAQLSDGTDTLVSGAGELSEGSTELSDGTDQLLEGIDALAEGSDTLAEGMETFDSEAVKEITDKLEGTVETFLDQMTKISDVADDYQIFTQLAEGQSGKVTFLIETAAISAE